MGINGLLPALRSITKPVHISEYKGYAVAIDGYSWLHKGAYACSRELCEGIWTDRFVHYIMTRIDLLIKHGVTPIMVFDGGRMPMKAEEEDSRRRGRAENRAKAAAHMAAGNVSAALEFYQRCVDVTPAMAKQVIEVLKDRGVQFYVAPYEADAQMAYLALRGAVHAVITEDSDLLAYGCPRVLFKIDKFGNGEEIRLEELPSNRGVSLAGFSHHMFLSMCIMSGCDFLPSLPGVGPKTAHANIHKYKDFVKAVRNLRYNGTSVPRDYEVRFQLAIWVFRHQRVFCPTTRTMVHLRPLPPGGLGAADIDVPDALPADEAALTALDFLGPKLPDDVAAGIAAGDLDPCTHKPFDLAAIYRGCRHPPPRIAALLDRHHPHHGHASGSASAAGAAVTEPPQRDTPASGGVVSMADLIRSGSKTPHHQQQQYKYHHHHRATASAPGTMSAGLRPLKQATPRGMAQQNALQLKSAGIMKYFGGAAASVQQQQEAAKGGAPASQLHLPQPGSDENLDPVNVADGDHLAPAAKRVRYVHSLGLSRPRTAAGAVPRNGGNLQQQLLATFGAAQQEQMLAAVLSGPSGGAGDAAAAAGIASEVARSPSNPFARHGRPAAQKIGGGRSWRLADTATATQHADECNTAAAAFGIAAAATDGDSGAQLLPTAAGAAAGPPASQDSLPSIPLNASGSGGGASQPGATSDAAATAAALPWSLTQEVSLHKDLEEQRRDSSAGAGAIACGDAGGGGGFFPRRPRSALALLDTRSSGGGGALGRNRGSWSGCLSKQQGQTQGPGGGGDVWDSLSGDGGGGMLGRSLSQGTSEGSRPPLLPLFFPPPGGGGAGSGGDTKGQQRHLAVSHQLHATACAGEDEAVSPVRPHALAMMPPCPRGLQDAQPRLPGLRKAAGSAEHSSGGGGGASNFFGGGSATANSSLAAALAAKLRPLTASAAVGGGGGGGGGASGLVARELRAGSGRRQQRLAAQDAANDDDDVIEEAEPVSDEEQSEDDGAQRLLLREDVDRARRRRQSRRTESVSWTADGCNDGDGGGGLLFLEAHGGDNDDKGVDAVVGPAMHAGADEAGEQEAAAAAVRHDAAATAADDHVAVAASGHSLFHSVGHVHEYARIARKTMNEVQQSMWASFAFSSGGGGASSSGSLHAALAASAGAPISASSGDDLDAVPNATTVAKLPRRNPFAAPVKGVAPAPALARQPQTAAGGSIGAARAARASVDADLDFGLSVDLTMCDDDQDPPAAGRQQRAVVATTANKSSLPPRVPAARKPFQTPMRKGHAGGGSSGRSVGGGQQQTLMSSIQRFAFRGSK